MYEISVLSGSRHKSIFCIIQLFLSMYRYSVYYFYSTAATTTTDVQSLARPRATVPWSTQSRRRRPLRSAGTNRLVVPAVRLATVANRAFPVVGPQIWNNLPSDVTSAESLTTFRQRLKTHLFSKSFPGYFLDIN